MLQLQSELSEPVPPENLTVSNSTPSNSKADNVAFIAKEFNITEFHDDAIEILLRKAKGRQRRKRETYMLDILVQNAIYRVAQRNTDNSEVKYHMGGQYCSYMNYITTFIFFGEFCKAKSSQSKVLKSSTQFHARGRPFLNYLDWFSSKNET